MTIKMPHIVKPGNDDRPPAIMAGGSRQLRQVEDETPGPDRCRRQAAGNQPHRLAARRSFQGARIAVGAQDLLKTSGAAAGVLT
jgi:hypothetical protein